MIITQIELQNFGIFRGETIINLCSEDNGRPIVLLGGRNGSGKTTLLHAIKIALYGPLSFGTRNVSEAYFQYIESHFNLYELHEGQKEFHVGVSFSIQQHGCQVLYTIKRSWERSNGQLVETYCVFKNKEVLSEQSATDFDEYIRKFYPPTLFNLFFFDGERIDEIFSSGFVQNGLRKAVLTLFNLDLFEQLHKDLSTYLAQANAFGNLSDEEKTFNALEEDLQKVTQKKDLLSSELQMLNEQLDNHQREILHWQNEFRAYGGLQAQERDSLQAQIAEIESRKDQDHEFIKDFIANLLPMLLVRKRVENILHKVHWEEKQQAYDSVSAMLLNKELITHIQDELIKHVSEPEKSKDLASLIIRAVQLHIRPPEDVKGSNIMHGLSWEEKQQLQNTYQKIQDFDPKEIIGTFARINSSITNVQEMRQRLIASTENSELDNILSKVQQLNELRTGLVLKRQKTTLDLESLELEQKKLESDKEQILERLKAAEKDENIFGLSGRIQEIIEKFIAMQMDNKIQEFQQNFETMFNRLIRKEDMVGRITFDKSMQDLQIWNKSGLPMSHSNLSAGETQIFILSLIWALIATSGRSLPVVFDSLLGRLDHTHKSSIVNKFLPALKNQTLILSTDTEIDSIYYEQMKSYLGCELLMNYDLETKRVSVSQGYFVGKRGDDLV